jgi:hypothetical protein
MRNPPTTTCVESYTILDGEDHANPFLSEVETLGIVSRILENIFQKHFSVRCQTKFVSKIYHMMVLEFIKSPSISDFRGGFFVFSWKLPFESRKGNGEQVCEASFGEHRKIVFDFDKLSKVIFVDFSELLSHKQ